MKLFPQYQETIIPFPKENWEKFTSKIQNELVPKKFFFDFTPYYNFELSGNILIFDSGNFSKSRSIDTKWKLELGRNWIELTLNETWTWLTKLYIWISLSFWVPIYQYFAKEEAWLWWIKYLLMLTFFIHLYHRWIYYKQFQAIKKIIRMNI